MPTQPTHPQRRYTDSRIDWIYETMQSQVKQTAEISHKLGTLEKCIHELREETRMPLQAYKEFQGFVGTVKEISSIVKAVSAVMVFFAAIISGLLYTIGIGF